MKLTKDNRKACLNIIKLLMKIIDNGLPYSQLQRLQGEDSNGIIQLINDWNKLIKHNRICCLMGYLLADAKFQKAGGSDDGESMKFNGRYNIAAFEQYVGFDCSAILVASAPQNIEEALTWFIAEFCNKLKESDYGRN